MEDVEATLDAALASRTEAVQEGLADADAVRACDACKCCVFFGERAREVFLRNDVYRVGPNGSEKDAGRVCLKDTEGERLEDVGAAPASNESIGIPL